MSALQAQVQSAGQRNQELLHGLAETDYAPSALSEQNKYITDLEAQLKESERAVRDAKYSTTKERGEHLKYEESTVRRFAHRVTGQKDKFQQKASKEEREYFEAVRGQKAAEDHQALLLHNRDQAVQARTNLEPVARHHDQLQQELDALYNHIFQGPTPDFPEEDQQEQTTIIAQDRYNQVSAQWDTEKTIISILTEAARVMQRVLQQMGEAHSASQWDMMGGGVFTDLAERSSLANAENGVLQVRKLMEQARRLHNQVGDVGPMNVAQGSIMSDVIFDNIFTDYAFHEKIKASEVQLQRAAQNLTQELDAARQRERGLQWEQDQAMAQLHQARERLQSVRSRAFHTAAQGFAAGGNQWGSKW